jgi:hypothetical protein
MHINRVKILSSTGIPFDLWIYLPCRGRDAHNGDSVEWFCKTRIVNNEIIILGNDAELGSHGCLDGLGILHSKLGKYVLNVLCLADKGALLELLDLKS